MKKNPHPPSRPLALQAANGPEEVWKHLLRAAKFLLEYRDERGLTYIDQGDWCDPMNMVGYLGRGVSGWLTIATSVALNSTIRLLEERALKLGPLAVQDALLDELRERNQEIHQSVQEYLWEGNWYARGITDANLRFGISKDLEGQIFLNPQSWALWANIPDEAQTTSILSAIDEKLIGPYGVEMLAPPFTQMRQDVGRVTQKFPGSAENGSVYNHAAAFYIHAMYRRGEADRAFQILRLMLAGTNDSDLKQRGQLPIFVPNYYRGAHRLHPRTAGRSSQLFNTGTAAWLLRSITEDLVGIRGTANGVVFAPQLPEDWSELSAIRTLRGARFEVQIHRETAAQSSAKPSITVIVNGESIPDGLLKDVRCGQSYQVDIRIH